MKGYYARFVDSRLPPVVEIVRRVGNGTFYACYHHTIGDGYMVEIASVAKWSPECVGVHILEFFGEAMLEAGGVLVENGLSVVPERRNPLWRRFMGSLTFLLDDVDICHPRALHASDFCRSIM